jgi:hypothetical protein
MLIGTHYENSLLYMIDLDECMALDEFRIK